MVNGNGPTICSSCSAGHSPKRNQLYRSDLSFHNCINISTCCHFKSELSMHMSFTLLDRTISKTKSALMTTEFEALSVTRFRSNFRIRFASRLTKKILIKVLIGCISDPIECVFFRRYHRQKSMKNLWCQFSKATFGQLQFSDFDLLILNGDGHRFDEFIIQLQSFPYQLSCCRFLVTFSYTIEEFDWGLGLVKLSFSRSR